MDPKDQAWKERGVGTLKVNVHKSCIEFDEYDGKPIPGSFDASQGDEGQEGKGIIAARLIMRQDNTHKLILNTAIIRALKFIEKSGTGAGKQFMFTAFDAGKPINMLIRVGRPLSKFDRKLTVYSSRRRTPESSWTRWTRSSRVFCEGCPTTRILLHNI